MHVGLDRGTGGRVALSRCWMCLGLLLTHWPTGPASAQWPPQVVPGARVQVRLPEAEFQDSPRRGHLLRGRVVRLVSDSLYLAVTDSVGPLSIPRSLIERLEYSLGVPSRTSSALGRGLRAGAGSALLLVLLNEIQDDPEISTGEAALLGGGVGFAVGAVVGALRPEERWRRVRLGVAVPAPF
jgi:hypothetical protein